jgi:hypothetical protein
MCRTASSLHHKYILITALVSALVAGTQLRAAAKSDPHRPACVDAQCRKIMSFLKAHYCSESPYGDGPEAGCQIKTPKGPRPGVDIVGWSLAAAYYSRTAHSTVELCQVIVVIDQSSHVLVLRKLPFQKTDVERPAVTQWYPIDLADADGDGHADVILQGDAYEDHWLEVVSVGHGASRTVFSGLGYYL